ncbi:peptidoglycan glycosyltransferase [Alicyclobacillus cycloheptanicus]|uniref:Penicillin-binding protein 2 n=1 Tax=Alicyclobacillus cycloheptanicus TaxID=1457 RepID=A0ABT9XFP4_9BACL|nr:penicillin-binding transpeptidase domain-containing protein [Alicyclobacillus cycloheptanicus]MDQ0189114.1 penicillin-binding protein 2 [Alicyclobacillus cycloheptanicus]WDM00244.1 peptidoglycan glycosyltransferase [Alicyclobacillus cycloheptanicus]
MATRQQRSQIRRSEEDRLTDRRRRTHLFRVNVVFSCVFLALSSLIFRLGYLQITKGAYFRSQAKTTSVQNIPVLPARGRIYDTNGNLLAYDEPIYSVYFTRVKNINTSSGELKKIAALLAPVFHTTEAHVLALLNADPQYSTITLFKNITEDQLTFISEHAGQLPGVDVQMDGQREYPYKDLAGQVLGYVGAITPQNEAYYVKKKGYKEIQQVGVAGLEYEYENLLQGKVGYQQVQYSTVNGSTKPVGYIPPVSGDNLKLTLDGRVQADTQNAVLQAIQNYERQNHQTITDAAAVMINVKTGGIIAMASYPYLDPNWMVPGGDFTQHAQYLSSSGAEINNAIQSPLDPGSTVKPVNLMIGLEHGVITPNTEFDDNAPVQMIGTYPMKEDASYGWINDIQAIAVSDDRFFYNVGLDLGHWLGSTPTSGGYPQGGNYQKWLNTDFIKGILDLAQGEMRFGLGELTGIDLPGEQAGNFEIEDLQAGKKPTNVQLSAKQIQQIAETVKKTGQYVNYGSPYDLAGMAFGQMQQFTPIELLQYVATIADNGKKLQPHLLQAVYPPGLEQSLANTNEKPISTVKPVVQANLKINPTYLKLAQEGMYAACNTPEGTAYDYFGDAPYKAAGKTGTAEITMHGQSVNNSVFIGYAPYNDPQIAVAVMVPGAGYGAVTAVPIARQMMDDYFDEHHESFMPKSQWTNGSIPANWTSSPAYKLPEESK